MAIGMSIWTSVVNELFSPCSACHRFSDSRLNQRLGSAAAAAQFEQKFPRFRASASLKSSRLLRESSSNPRSAALGSSDSGSSKDESPSSSQRSEDGSVSSSSASSAEKKQSPAQSALARALAYKKAKQAAQGLTERVKVDQTSAADRPENAPEVEIVRGQNIQSRLQSTDSSPSASESSSLPIFSSSLSIPPTGGDSPPKSGMKASLSETEKMSQVSSEGPSTPTVEVGKSIEENLAAMSMTTDSDLAKEVIGEAPDSEAKKESTVSLDAFKKAQAYKQQQAEMIAALKEKPNEPATVSADSSSAGSTTPAGPRENLIEVEIVTREGVVKKLVNPEKAFSNVKEFKRTGVSSIDFSGLGFADKKQGGRKIIREDYQAPPPGALPEVEIITKDAGTGQATAAAADGDENDLYKPKVSTWGLFPRPADISKTYGGGRTIRPGDVLETEEERIAREAKTQKLLADYKKKMGLDVDPRVKSECEKLFKQGNSLMESGDLKTALALFEEVMEKMVFQSELHGSAALQGAICLDSLARFEEAREIYEKLVSHPNGKIRKQAQKLLYGFRAMENLKVSTANEWDTSVYAQYFEAFADGYNNTYKATEEEKTEKLMEQTLAYSLLLFFPILLVVVLALSKNSGT